MTTLDIYRVVFKRDGKIIAKTTASSSDNTMSGALSQAYHQLYVDYRVDLHDEVTMKLLNSRSLPHDMQVYPNRRTAILRWLWRW